MTLKREKRISRSDELESVYQRNIITLCRAIFVQLYQ